MAGVDVNVRTSGAWRATSGRFARAETDIEKQLDAMAREWGRSAVAALREATPMEEEPIGREHPAPGTAKRLWRADTLRKGYEGATVGVKVSNASPYLGFHVTGTAGKGTGYIYPLYARHLVFLARFGPGAGGMVARRRVKGIPPNPHLLAAIERLGPLAASDFSAAGSKIVQRLMVGT